MYRKDLEQQFNSNTPCIPFLGVFLTQIVQQDSYDQCRAKTGCGIRKHSSCLGNYTILEAITVRNQFEKLKCSHSGRKRGGHYAQCITSRKGRCKENDSSESESEDSGYVDPSSSQLPEESQHSFQSLAPAATEHAMNSPATSQSLQCNEQHQERDGQRNSEGIPSFSVPPQRSQNTVVPISPRGTTRAKPCGLVRERSMSDPALDVLDLRPKFDSGFADDMLIHSQSLESLQDSDLDLSRSSSASTDTLDSLSSDDEQIPALQLSPRFNTTLSLPPRSPGAPPLCYHKRRATTVVLRLRLANLNCSTSPSDLLQKYQFFSLGCCRGVESRTGLRALLTDASNNTEGQNYKLSCQREP